MKHSLVIIFAFLIVAKMDFTCAENNINGNILKLWPKWGKPYGCEKEFVAVNYQNNKPVKGACVPIGYDTNETPNPESVTDVFSSIDRLKLLGVDDIEKTITIDTKVSSRWQDDRIKVTLDDNHSYLRLSPDIVLPKIWLPFAFDIIKVKTDKPTLDPFLYSELRFFLSNITDSNSTTLNITVESRTTVYCDFDLHKFPFDTQTCEVISAVRDPDRLQFWLDDSENPTYSPKTYQACGYDVSTDIRNYTNGIIFDIQLKRLFLPFMLQYYFLCNAIVIVSFISFIVPLSASPGRIGLIVTQFLTLTNIFMHQIVSILN